MLQKKFFSLLLLASFIPGISVLTGCSVAVPKLGEMEAKAPVKTTYTNALNDLNTVLETYLRPDYPDTIFHIKPARDDTGLSATGEIPINITAMVRDALARVHYKVRYVASLNDDDIKQMQAELLRLQLKKLQGINVHQAERPAIDFSIEGSISEFDRNLESTSDKARAMLAFGGGAARTDINASAEHSSRLSNLGVSFSVYDHKDVSLPGNFGANMEVVYAKNGVDIGFAIYGNGLGYGVEATAMHGRHKALRMMTEFSVVRIVGRALNVPYWRIGEAKNIFERDQLVLNEWRNEYQGMGRDLIPYMQAQCIANGDSSVAVTGQLDGPTQAAFDRFAAKYGVSNRSYPNFELYQALEENRILSSGTARNAWAAYAAYKGGARPSAPAVAAPAPASSSPAASSIPPKKPAVTPVSTPASRPARPAATSAVQPRRPAVAPAAGRTRPAVSRPARSSGSGGGSNPLQGLID